MGDAEFNLRFGEYARIGVVERELEVLQRQLEFVQVLIDERQPHVNLISAYEAGLTVLHRQKRFDRAAKSQILSFNSKQIKMAL